MATPRTWVVGEVVTAALMNAEVRDQCSLLLNPPIFAAYQSAAQSIANTTVTALTMDTEIVDTYSGHSTVTNTSRYTCQLAGYYLIVAQVGYAVNASGNRLVEIHKNGGATLQLGQGVGFAPTTANTAAKQVATLVLLAVGDYVEGFTYQTSGGSLNTAPTQTGMTAIWIHA